ncbi:hypothetical protein AAFF_G00347640 [Aldrovandia affinis]|uniref:Uncharacterized protein n=1 Tax=Aldrovandia affinis TaxID=143900 RepID=A0AAD7SLY9_9TELE|nr:hypothetical protein AAFF_G00347640 [Aldrovandia affinis]
MGPLSFCSGRSHGYRQFSGSDGLISCLLLQFKESGAGDPRPVPPRNLQDTLRSMICASVSFDTPARVTELPRPVPEAPAGWGDLTGLRFVHRCTSAGPAAIHTPLTAGSRLSPCGTHAPHCTPLTRTCGSAEQSSRIVIGAHGPM